MCSTSTASRDCAERCTLLQNGWNTIVLILCSHSNLYVGPINVFFVIRHGSFLQNNQKELDLSCVTDLNLLNWKVTQYSIANKSRLTYIFLVSVEG